MYVHRKSKPITCIVIPRDTSQPIISFLSERVGKTNLCKEKTRKTSQKENKRKAGLKVCKWNVVKEKKTKTCYYYFKTLIFYTNFASLETKYDHFINRISSRSVWKLILNIVEIFWIVLSVIWLYTGTETDYILLPYTVNPKKLAEFKKFKATDCLKFFSWRT